MISEEEFPFRNYYLTELTLINIVLPMKAYKLLIYQIKSFKLNY